jgi:orotate phosphoribosyltransferase
MASGVAAKVIPISSVDEKRERLLEIIKKKSLLTGKTFVLASGATSTYYLDMKPTMFDPEGASLIAELVYNMVKSDHSFTAIGGLELGAVPIISIVCARSWPDRPIDGFVVRKEKKGHGTDKKIDGNFKPGSTVILLDDVTTKGGSVMQAVDAVREQKGTVTRIITVVDRGEGAAEKLKQAGITLLPLFTTEDLLN